MDSHHPVQQSSNLNDAHEKNAGLRAARDEQLLYCDWIMPRSHRLCNKRFVQRHLLHDHENAAHDGASSHSGHGRDPDDEDRSALIVKSHNSPSKAKKKSKLTKPSGVDRGICTA